MRVNQAKSSLPVITKISSKLPNVELSLIRWVSTMQATHCISKLKAPTWLWLVTSSYTTWSFYLVLVVLSPLSHIFLLFKGLIGFLTLVLHHIFSMLSSFATHAPTHSTVTLPNNSVVHATHIGSVQISSDLTLHDVLCVPLFHFNPLVLSSSNYLVQSLFSLTIAKSRLSTGIWQLGWVEELTIYMSSKLSHPQQAVMLSLLHIPYGIVKWVIILCLNFLYYKILFTLILIYMILLWIVLYVI